MLVTKLAVIRKLCIVHCPLFIELTKREGHAAIDKMCSRNFSGSAGLPKRACKIFIGKQYHGVI